MTNDLQSMIENLNEAIVTRSSYDELLEDKSYEQRKSANKNPQQAQRKVSRRIRLSLTI